MHPVNNKNSDIGFQSSSVPVSKSGSSTYNRNRSVNPDKSCFLKTQVSTNNTTHSNVRYITGNFRPANNMMNRGVSQTTNIRMRTSLNSGVESYPTFTVTSCIPTASYSELYLTRFVGTRPINTNQVPSTPSVAPEASTGLAATKNFISLSLMIDLKYFVVITYKKIIHCLKMNQKKFANVRYRPFKFHIK